MAPDAKDTPSFLRLVCCARALGTKERDPGKEFMFGNGALLGQSNAYLFGESLPAELHDLHYKLHLRHPRFHSVYSPVVFQRMI